MIVEVFGSRFDIRGGVPMDELLDSLRSNDSASDAVRLEVDEPRTPVTIVGALNECAARPRNTSLVALHAGYVELDGSGVVIPGPSYCGKSTLVAALCRFAGARYGGDELCAMQLDDGAIVPYRKPLSLKVATWPLI